MKINKPLDVRIVFLEADFQQLPLTPEQFGELQKSDEKRKMQLEVKKVKNNVCIFKTVG